MYLTIILFRDENKLKKLISIMLECGLYDSSVMDGEGIENLASTTAPIFSEITTFFGHELVYNRVIFTYVSDKSSLKEFVKLCKKEGIDFNNDSTGKLAAFKSDFDINEQ